MQLVRHQDALCFIQGANLARDNNALAFQQEVGAWAGGVNARADKLEKDLDKPRSEFATALGELTKAKKEIQRLAELTAVPPVEPAAKIRPLPVSTTVSSLEVYELTPEDVEMTNPYEVKSRSKKTRPTAIEINEPEVEYTPLGHKEAESVENWLANRAAIRARNQTKNAPRVGLAGAPEAGLYGIARKRQTSRRDISPEMTVREWLRSREVDIEGRPRHGDGNR